MTAAPPGDGPRLLVRRLRPEATLPQAMSEAAAGVDLAAAAEATLPSGGWARVPTGIAVAVPPGHEGQVRPRSGLAARWGVTVLNAPGTIDADFRGEIEVILVNHGAAPYRVRAGDRIAQLVIAPVVRVAVTESSDLPPTRRGEGGFGHTG